MPVIRDLQFLEALSPLSRPIADSTHQIEQIAFLVARLELGPARSANPTCWPSTTRPRQSPAQRSATCGPWCWAGRSARQAAS